MGLRDRILRLTNKTGGRGGNGDSSAQAESADAAKDLAQYKYLLRVASPGMLEQVHREAFAALAPEPRERLLLRLQHDLPEETRPTASEPDELARAAVAAHQGDPGYLVRMLRRPGLGVTEGRYATESIAAPSVGLLFAGSVLGPVASVAATTDSAADLLEGFENSPEAAQLSAEVHVRWMDAPGVGGVWDGGGGGLGANMGDGGGGGGM
jgi:hypothetical protein